MWYVAMSAIKHIMSSEVTRAFPGALLGVFCYGDDLLFLFARRRDAAPAFNLVLEVAKRLGVPLSGEKCTPPCRALRFLGFDFDLDAGTIAIPDNKLVGLRSELADLVYGRFGEPRPTMPLKCAQRLLGIILFVRTCCPPARFLTNRFADAMRGRGDQRFVRLSQEIRADFRVMMTFLARWNGVGFVPPAAEDRLSGPAAALWGADSITVTTDAAVVFGMGGFVDEGLTRRHFFSTQWSAADLEAANRGRRAVSTAVLELRAAVEAVRVFGARLRRRRVVLRVDNVSVLQCVNRGRTEIPELQDLLRELGSLCMEGAVWIRAVHITSHDNAFADACSRGNLSGLQVLAGGRRLTRVFPPSQWGEAPLCGGAWSSSSTVT